MTRTVTTLYSGERHAIAAANDLEQAGIPQSQIDIWSTPHNLAPVLEDGGVSRTDTEVFVEGVVRGGTVVIVSCRDDQVREVTGILNREGVLDLDEQRAAWQAEGWQDRAATEPSEHPAPGSARGEQEAEGGKGIVR